MINRRSFILNRGTLLSAGGAGLIASAALGGPGPEAEAAAEADAEASPKAARNSKPPYLEFRIFRMQMGSQNSRMQTWAEKRLMPLLAKYGFSPTGFFTEAVGPNIPSFYSLFSYAGLAERERLWEQVVEDPAWAKGVEELESGDEPPFHTSEGWLLRATDYSPALQATPKDRNHSVYELRIYESPTEKQLRALHERFAGPEIPIFHRSGIHPVFYSSMANGPKMPNLTYLTPFENLAAREKAWQAFRTDPAWPPALQESIQRSGQIVRNITVLLLTPTKFSQLH